MAKTKLQETWAACIVLENYLDGAMADMENGEVENTDFIKECIAGLKVLGDATYMDYEKRFNEYMERSKQQ